MVDLIDIGANLTAKAFKSDQVAVIKRAREAGVTRMVVTGSSVEESQRAANLAERYPAALFATAGVHPHNAKDCDEDTLASLRSLALNPVVVAIGECGLDFNRDFSPRPVQLEWFESQCQLAGELRMPLFLHERDASEAFRDVIKNHRSDVPAAVVHCFTGDGTALDSYLDLDLHIGITGWICDERRGVHLKELVRRIPSDRLMIETDAPYLVPRTIHPRPGRNEPAFLPHVLSTVSECLDRPVEEVALETTRTAERFFDLDQA